MEDKHVRWILETAVKTKTELYLRPSTEYSRLKKKNQQPNNKKIPNNFELLNKNHLTQT